MKGTPPIYSIRKKDVNAALFENTNNRTGKVFYSLIGTMIPESVSITMGANQYKRDGDKKPDFWGPVAEGFKGRTGRGTQTLTVRIKDAAIAEQIGTEELVLYDNTTPSAPARAPPAAAPTRADDSASAEDILAFIQEHSTVDGVCWADALEDLEGEDQVLTGLLQDIIQDGAIIEVSPGYVAPA